MNPNGRLALFADCMLIGLFTAIASVPLVTVLPAFAAGCSLLSGRVNDTGSVTVRGYIARLRQALRSGASAYLVPPIGFLILIADGVAVAAGVPGGQLLAPALAMAASLAFVVTLRAAARWSPQAGWLPLIRAAARDLARDPGGSALLWLAGAAAVVISLFTPITLLLIAGPLALAAVAINGRRA